MPLPPAPPPPSLPFAPRDHRDTISDMSIDLDDFKPRPVAPVETPNSIISSSSDEVHVMAEGLEPMPTASPLPSDAGSDTTTPACSDDESERSGSETYVEDLGGPVLRDENWESMRVSRCDVSRTYDSTDDESDASDESDPRRRAEREALAFLDGAEVYDDWAVVADDELSLEDLQDEADAITAALEEAELSPLEREDGRSRGERKRRRRPPLQPEEVMIIDGDVEFASPASGDLKRIETLVDESDGAREFVQEITPVTDEPDVEFVTEPARRRRHGGHARVETLPDGELDAVLAMRRPRPGHKRIETLADEDAIAIEILPPVLRGLPRVESLEEADVEEIVDDVEVTGCGKLAEICERVDTVTRGLADVQMLTAGQAASAEVCLGRSDRSSLRAEVCQLRITLDHLARLTLERAYAVRDEAELHR